MQAFEFFSVRSPLLEQRVVDSSCCVAVTHFLVSPKKNIAGPNVKSAHVNPCNHPGFLHRVPDVILSDARGEAD
jgi:hypothetical protein